MGKILRCGVHGLLFVLIAVVVVSMIPHGTRQAGAPGASNILISSKFAADTANTIVAAHLFGRAQQKPAENTPAASITVDGIAAASNLKDSIAVLTLNGQSGEFHAGQVLPDGEKLTAINPDGVELAGGSNVRRIALATYGTPDSQGPAAYAALLHGVGLSSPGNNQQNAPGAFAEPGAADNPAQSLPFLPATVPNSTPLPAAGIVNISPQATPLEQLHALRSQLIHPR
ncbi:MAG: hypothetical protein KGJ20_04500 [Gammaproteobacteria bacterium]|nr:hypothetical protein [Gammaproteobacteria bacterium]MDE2108447.1 hypothetical protein [Gammaproteobacteria bacterium]